MDAGLEIGKMLSSYISFQEGPAFKRMVEGFLDSPFFLDTTFEELLNYLKSDMMVDEFKLYNSVLRWSRTKCTNPEDLRELKRVSSRQDEVDLFSFIRVSLFGKDNWDRIRNSKELALLPLSYLDIVTLDDFFNAKNENEKKTARDLLLAVPDTKINFNPRQVYRDLTPSVGWVSRKKNHLKTTLGGPVTSDYFGALITNSTDNGTTPDPRGSKSVPSPQTSTPVSSPNKRVSLNFDSGPVGTSKIPSRSVPKRPTSRVAREVILASSDYSDNDDEDSQEEPLKMNAKTKRKAITRRKAPEPLENLGTKKRKTLPRVVKSSSLKRGANRKSVAIEDKDATMKLTATSSASSRGRNVNNRSTDDNFSISDSDKSDNDDDSFNIGSVSHADKVDYKVVPEHYATFFKKLGIKAKTASVEKICVQFNIKFHEEGVIQIFPRPLFQKITEFHINFNFNQTQPEDNQLCNRFKNFALKQIDLKKFICFNTKINQDWNLNELWNLGVNLSLIFHGCTLIKINHQKQEFILNGCRNKEQSVKLISGLNDANLKKLALGRCELRQEFQTLNFDSIEKLVLYGVYGELAFNDILQNCNSLTELTLWKSKNIDNKTLKSNPMIMLESVDLSKIKNPQKLERLALCQSKISFKLGVTGPFLNVHTVHINNSVVFEDFDKAFPILFPNVQTVSLGKINVDGSPISLSLIIRVLKIQTLQWIRVDEIQWESTNLGQEFEKLTGVKRTKFTTFILEKNVGKKGPIWKIVKDLNSKESANKDIPGGYYDTIDEQEVEFYQLDNFYGDFSPQVSRWLTFSSFHLGFD